MKNIQNTKNVVNLPSNIHAVITGKFNSVYYNGGLKYARMRDYVKTLDFDKQYEFMINLMKQLGYGSYIK